MKLSATTSKDLHKDWKLINSDSYTDIPGAILEADEEAQKAKIDCRGEALEITQPFKILRKGR